MINQVEFFNSLNKNGIDFFTGVPDSLLNDFCKHLGENVTANKHIIAANEGNAIGIASGYYLKSNEIPLVYMQNSGMGNAFNPLASLVDKKVYSIPMVLLIGWRGDPDISDHVQHERQGSITLPLLDMLDIPYQILSEECDYEEIVTSLVKQAKSSNLPVALVVKKNILAQPKGIETYENNDKFELTRNEAIESILDNLPKDTIYVASTGRITRELYWLREKRNESHNNDILNVGAMGHASSIALGVALADSTKSVVCLDGDASAIMHMGALAINGSTKCKNFIHIVLNNGAHESVGGQDSVGLQIDLTEISRNCGYQEAVKIVDKKELTRIDFKTNNKPLFLEICVKKGMKESLPPLKFNPKARI